MFLQILSVIGALFLLGAYLALQAGWLRRASLKFQLSNLLGGAALLVVAVADVRWGFILLNGTWTLIAAFAIVALARGKQPPGEEVP